MSFKSEQRKKALHVAEHCIECGRCFQFCQFNIFPKEHMKCFYLIKQANNAIMFGTKVSSELRDMLFKCSVCNRCQDVCPEGLNRSDANLYLKLKLPNPLKQNLNIPSLLPHIKSNLSTTLAIGKKNSVEKKWLKSINQPQNAKILVYHGCYLDFSKEECMKVENILTKAKEEFVSFGGSKYCCNGISGYRGEAKFNQSYSRLSKMIAKVDPFEIITSCGHCYEVLCRVVYEMDRDIKVRHTSEKIFDLITEKRLKLHKIPASIAIQDACLTPHLYSDKGAIRSILKRIVSIKEMEHNKDKSYCCGNVSLAYDRKLVESQVEKISKDFKNTKATHICVYCTRCKEIFDRDKKDFKSVNFIDLVYDSIFNKHKVIDSEFVPMPKKEDISSEDLISYQEKDETESKIKKDKVSKDTSKSVSLINNEIKKIKKSITKKQINKKKLTTTKRK